MRKYPSPFFNSDIEEVLDKKYAKIIILGDVGVGKTAIIQWYCTGNFHSNRRATLGLDYQQKRVKLRNGGELTLQIWDTAGQEQFKSLSQLYFRDSQACIMVYDVTKRESFNNLNSWVQEYLEKKQYMKNEGYNLDLSNYEDQHNEKITIIVVGNKSDLIMNVKEEKKNLS